MRENCYTHAHMHYTHTHTHSKHKNATQLTGTLTECKNPQQCPQQKYLPILLQQYSQSVSTKLTEFKYWPNPLHVIISLLSFIICKMEAYDD